jgi:hypothetical protein
MFHLDYLSCFLTILATILLARKCWIGLLLAIINSVIVCAIGVHTLQLGFIPANLFASAYTWSAFGRGSSNRHVHIEITRSDGILIRLRMALGCTLLRRIVSLLVPDASQLISPDLPQPRRWQVG